MRELLLYFIFFFFSTLSTQHVYFVAVAQPVAIG